MNPRHTDNTYQDKQMDREFIQTLREGIDIVRMVFFIRMRDHLMGNHPERGKKFSQMLAGAILNELFGIQNPEKEFAAFASKNASLIQEELRNVPKNFEDLLIPLTDALRMHFLCNHQDGMPDYSLAVLAKAKDYGILLEERNAPLPKGFMEMVYRVGKAYGLVVEQTPSAKPS